MENRRRKNKSVFWILCLLLIPISAGAPLTAEDWRLKYFRALKGCPGNIERRLKDNLLLKAANALVYYADFRDIENEVLFRLVREESEFKIYAFNRTSEARSLLQLTKIALIEYCHHYQAEWKTLFYVDEKGHLIRDKHGQLVVNKWSVYNPEISVKVGTWLLAKLRKDYGGDMKEALVAYNAGSGRLAQIRFAENYAERIINRKSPSYFKTMEFRLLLILCGIFLISIGNLYWAIRLKLHEKRKEWQNEDRDNVGPACL